MYENVVKNACVVIVREFWLNKLMHDKLDTQNTLLPNTLRLGWEFHEIPSIWNTGV